MRQRLFTAITAHQVWSRLASWLFAGWVEQGTATDIEKLHAEIVAVAANYLEHLHMADDDSAMGGI